MMNEPETANKEGSLICIEGARDALARARYNLDGGFFGVAVNRAYYAFFYAATALLLTLNTTRSKHASRPGEARMSELTVSRLTDNEQAAIEEYAARIRGRYPDRIRSITLFGSKARGEASEGSDVDLLLLVEAEDRELTSALWRIASDVSLEHNVVLSVRVFAEARWAESRRMRLPLYRAVQAEGIPLAC